MLPGQKTTELYLGEYKGIFQVKEGENTPKTEMITDAANGKTRKGCFL